MTPLRLLLPLLCAAPSGLAGQTVPADAGTLVVRQNGAIVAEESFEIRGDGTALTVTSTARWGAASIVTLAVYTPRRVTVRLSGAGGEVAREFPTGGTLILDDSSFVFLLLLPQHPPGALRLARPRSTDRLAATLTDHGLSGAGARAERRVTLTFDNQTVQAWFDSDGRFLRAEIPARNLEITLLTPR